MKPHYSNALSCAEPEATPAALITPYKKYSLPVELQPMQNITAISTAIGALLRMHPIVHICLLSCHGESVFYFQGVLLKLPWWRCHGNTVDSAIHRTRSQGEKMYNIDSSTHRNQYVIHIARSLKTRKRITK